MSVNNDNCPLIVVLGPTASGKTALALDLAQLFDGEIICADSRTIYRGMDIGTAKPTSEELARIPHHLLDIVDPNEILSVAAFKILAETAILDISSRGKLPFLVGGSGLYIDSLLYDYQFPPEADPTLRLELEALTDAQLQDKLMAIDADRFKEVDVANRRRVIRAIETSGRPSLRSTGIRSNTLVLGLLLNKEVMQVRIEHRIEKMLEQGLIDEVRRVGETYGWDSEAMSGIGYRAFKEVVLGRKTVAEGVAEFARGDRQLVKKQITWFKRNHEIIWLRQPSEAAEMVDKFLQQHK